ncbi:DUF305 domain-containing protein [Gemmatimonas groenlandica]|uniref:DUF305 domain-containing protein n=1 Tax=Gemmatimonas groenlandica TaxID=2732249 RepID=A0A6M4IWC3_9BACT|nr:DUF305 domain-containing protein [Gemmatimonas groenlandica]QJR37826.1 DUF305 domain-containing protein [Gemmatimonas groenlandica]
MTLSRVAPCAILAFALTSVAPAVSAQAVSAADMAFVQGMIMHHAQAITMTAMVRTHTSRVELLLLAERIEVSQRDELAVMHRWLADHGASPQMHGAHAMPGMLSPAQLAELAAARDAAFDRLFLRLMIQHHDGALQMVTDLRRVPGAAQSPMLFQFVNDIDNDQRAEIRRMQTLLAAWSK